MKIEKHGRSYRVRQQMEGKTYIVSFDHEPTKKEVALALAERIKKPVVKKKDKKTFDEVFQLAIAKKSKIRNANTIERTKGYYKQFFTDKIKNKPIADFDFAYIDEYSLELLQRLELTSRAFSNYKSVLTLVFEYALQNNMVFYNYAENLKPKNYNNLFIVKEHNPEDKAFSQEQIDCITKEMNKRILKHRSRGKIYNYGYMFLLSINTGMRAGELSSLTFKDIKDNYIHIHTQLLEDVTKKTYYVANWTKNEKRVSKGGRMFPLTDNIKKVLDDLKRDKELLEYPDEYLFCDGAGQLISPEHYESVLGDLCRSLGYTTTNNHAIRMYFNSYVLIPLGISVANRAKLLGHSVQVNLQNYSHADHDYVDMALSKLNSQTENHLELVDNLVDNLVKMPFPKGKTDTK